MAPYQALTTLHAENEHADRYCIRSCFAVRRCQRSLIRAKSSDPQNDESAVSDLAPSRPEGTLSQVRYRALGAQVIEEKQR